MSVDPFMHLPHLRGLLTPAEESALRVTPEALAEWDVRSRALGRAADWRITDEAREATRHALLGGRDPAADVWVYAYGSLMWDPGIHFREVRLAHLDGFQRRFTCRSTIGRGSPEQPCLFLALEERPGACAGLAFRIAADAVETETAILWRREMVRGGYVPRKRPLRTAQGEVEALIFTSNHDHADYAGEASLAETAATIAAASGPIGTNRDYLAQVVSQLKALQIEDDYITTLWRHVEALGDGAPAEVAALQAAQGR